MDDVAGIRAEALDALSSAARWKLTEEHWRDLRPVLAGMADALESDDLAALAEAIDQLALASPGRIVPIGAAAGPPPEVHALLNRLVHTLGGVTADQWRDGRTDAGAAGADLPRD